MSNETTHQKQRLAIFLDGTWNTQDDSTNILHAHALTFEGMSEDGFMQRRYYDRGVGTGVFESVLGGGFGIGLEVNVREAYNWLLDHYNDGDEIYIFGFSRGAYSARSLVGFIAICGLIKRGAPLTNSQLWDGYVKISRARGKQKTLLEKIGTALPPPFRKIKSISKNADENNTTENLLKEWSRRVKITYLGIFDTVGAMGLEALGIQGIRSKSGLNHNQNPTKLIQKCRHALAIDEYRSSFRLTPFLHYVPNATNKEEVYKKGYHHIISQKWFVGAHSNIGGGYNDNLLAYFPLKWILEGAQAEGLQTRDLTLSKFPAKIDQVNDSYWDFTGIVWPHIFREKRHYRPINQMDTVVARTYVKKDKKTGERDGPRNGFTLTPIYEEIDESVIELIIAENDNNYVPPNLKNYANRLEEKEALDVENIENEIIDKEVKKLLNTLNSRKKIKVEIIVDKIIKNLLSNRKLEIEVYEKAIIEKEIKLLVAKQKSKEEINAEATVYEILKIFRANRISEKLLNTETIVDKIIKTTNANRNPNEEIKEKTKVENVLNILEIRKKPNKEISEKSILDNFLKVLLSNRSLTKKVNEKAVINDLIKTILPKRKLTEEVSEKRTIDSIVKILFANRNPNEKWLEGSAIARVILVCWATLAAIGIAFLLDGLLIKAPFINWESMAIIALVFTISDWAEFHFNLKTGINSSDIVSKVTLNVLMWMRLLGIILFFFGTVAFTLQCIDWGLSSEMTIDKIMDLVQEKNWYLIPFLPMVAVLFLDLFYNGWKDKAGESNLKAAFTKIIATILSPFVFLIYGFIITYFSGFLSGFSLGEITSVTTPNLITRELAGQLLIIQFLFLILNYTFIWVGKTTRKARLGFSIIGLQTAYTPKLVKELFDLMRYNISQYWSSNLKEERKSIAWENAKILIKDSLWRDILGFIPIYTFVFGAIIWLASTYGQHENWIWLSEEKILDFPIWIWIISITALADYLENIVHLKHVNNYPTSKSSYLLVLTGMFFTIIKSIGFIAGLTLSTLIFINLSIDILGAEPGGWRWLIAVLITLLILYIFGSLVIKYIRIQFSKSKEEG